MQLTSAEHYAPWCFSFEQVRRDSSLSGDHMCWVYFNEAEIPTKWNEMVVHAGVS